MSFKRTFARDVLLITFLLILAIPFYLGRPNIEESLESARFKVLESSTKSCDHALQALNEKYSQNNQKVASMTDAERSSLWMCFYRGTNPTLFAHPEESINQALTRIQKDIASRRREIQTQEFKYKFNTLILIIAMGLYPLILVVRLYKWLIITARDD